MMFQGWNGERTRLVWDTGIIQSLLIPSSNYSTAPLEQQGERKRTPHHSHFHQAALRMKKAGGLEEFMDEEERSDSECSSGCQSGWTLYLGQSQESFTVSVRVRTGEEEEEEDLSMLSDASSGPPLVHEDNNIRYCCCCCCYNEGDGCFANYRDKRRSSEEEKEKKLYFSLEDTASSPLFSCYKACRLSYQHHHLQQQKEI
ncbi:uncharacterized protein LOC110027247 isoform X2 [Phalaenopsis equestris]|uniref:uncharacterized protein LOC110027247 isoform X2 n=1 Tax=Phalaenopsis equestris TaxID=78828 RepID=UPI0009E21545|nr:uncharacterized protein LOC110027247 isoform X2 [Phalaenopsis equestris]